MSSNEPAEDGSGLIEELVARCLEESQGSGSEDAVARVCAGRPELAPRVRERLARLERVGLLGAPPGAPRFPGYTVHARLGSGGMAVVYAGREEASGALVALKTADPRLALSERALLRFRREIEAASRLRHERVVAVRAAGEVDGVPFYAMDFVAGATLGEVLDELRSGARAQEGAERGERAEALAVADLQRAWRARRHGEDEPRGSWGRTYVECACRIALDVAEALDHVHAHGIVHRDVKPSNVLIDADGRGNLFDLGLAHLSDDARLTRTGDFAGSPHYAAPEQIDGSPEGLDARADVYGLGATLFELIALRPPFHAKTTPELLRRILKQDAPGLRQVAPWAPRELEAICRACLEKEPRHRYASAAELAADLRSFLGFLPVRARPVGLARRTVRFARRNPAQALAAALGVTLLAGAPLVLVVHGRRIADERDLAAAAAAEARREADENREVSGFLESLILSLDDRGDAAHQAVARELIDEARARLDAQGDIRPLTRASLFHTVARVLGGMGREIDAVPLLDRCFAIRASELGDAHPETQAAVQELAALHLRLGDRQSARALAERGLRAVPADGAPSWAQAAAEETLGRIALEQRDLDQAEVRLERALVGFRAQPRGAEADEARALRSLGRLHLARGDAERAEELLALAQELVSSAWEPDLAELAEGARLLALVAEERGRSTEAAARWTEALHLHAKRGRALGAESLAILERLLPLQERRLGGGERPELAREAFEQYVLLGENRAAAGAPGPETAFERALELAARVRAPDQDLLGRAHLGRGRSLHAAGLDDAAWQHLLQAEAVRAQSHSVEAWVPELFDVALRTSTARADSEGLAGVLLAARGWFEGRIAAGGGSDAGLADALRAHALHLFELGRGVEAEPLLRGAELLARAAEPATPGLALALDDEREFDATMQRAITLLQAELDAEAAAALERCVIMRPRDPLPRYNLACALAGAGERERAFAALEQAIDLGYAYRERAAETTAADSDLAPLRDDPRFDVLLGRMRALAAGAEAYAAEPAEYVPEGVDPAAGAPLLVVLHKNGATKDSVVSGVWRGVADELGCVLLAPSGRIPASNEPEAGMLWLDSLERYAARSWYFEKPVRDALAAYKRRHAASPESVFIAGEELGGTLAFHLAVRSPELYRGCLLVDAAVPLELAADLAPSLSSLGLRVALIADPRWRPPGIPQGTTTPEYLVQTFRQLGEWGIETTLGTREDRSAEDAAPRLVAAMRFLSTGSREQ